MKRRKISHYIRPSFWVFLFIAALLWYGNKLSERYTTEIVLPIEVVNDYSSEMWIEEPLREIRCRVEGFGSKLLSYKMNFGDRISIPMSQLTLLPLNNSDHHFRMDKSSLTGAISSIVKDLRIHEVLDTALTISVSAVSSRRMAVSSRLSFNLAAQYMQLGRIRITPDSVDVRGPVVILDSMESIRTKPMQYNDLKKSVSARIDLEQRAGVLLSSQKVSYFIEVVPFTQHRVELMVEIKNLPAELKATIVPSRVKVILNAPLRDYERIGEGLLHATIDYRTIESGAKGRSFVRIDSLPLGGTVLRIEPQFVESFFTIR